MNIKENKIDELNLELTLSVAHEDYAEAKKKQLTEFRRRAEIKGFRKGMVPMSLVEKMYGQQALVDAVNDIISKTLGNYIEENKLRVIGEPLPSEDGPHNEWKDGNDFEFKFDIAQNPELTFELDAKDEIVYYTITATKEAKAEMKANMLRQYGSLVDGEAAKEEDFLIADFQQGETSVEGTYVSVRNIAEAVRPAFIGVKPGAELTVNVNEAFENETDRASMLKVTKEELASMDPEWKMTVINVKTFEPAALCQETYDKIFGEGQVADEAAFDAKIEERLKAEYVSEADYRFQKDAKDFLVEKSGVAVPEKFLKRWIFVANDGKFTMEEIEKEWPMFIEDYKWQLVREYLMRKLDVKVTEEDLLASAKGFAAYQFAMYGMNNMPDEQLESFAKNILSQEKEGRRIAEQVENEKTIAAVRGLVSLSKKRISLNNFRELK